MSNWRKPNAEGISLGYVAICIAQESIRQYGAKEGVIGRVPYLRTYRYTQAQLERRASHTDDLPEFWTAPQVRLIEHPEWNSYLAGEAVSEEFAERVKAEIGRAA